MSLVSHNLRSGLLRGRRRSLTLLGFFLLGVLGVLSACGGSSGSTTTPSTPATSTKPLVIATTPLLGDLVRQVGGEAIDVEVLIPVGSDPHDFEPSASQAARLRKAALIVANGLGLEENLERTLDGARNDGVTVFDLGEELDPISIADEHVDENAASEHGNEHGAEDPHFWLDPERMATAASVVAAQLAATTKQDPAAFEARAANYAAAAKAAMAEATDILFSVPEAQRKLVTNHDALEYFAQRFNLEVIGTVIPGGSTLAEPSASDIKDLVELINANSVKAIFSESTVSSKVIETVSREVGSRVQVIELSTDTLGRPGSATATYPGLIVATARLIANGLTGK